MTGYDYARYVRMATENLQYRFKDHRVPVVSSVVVEENSSVNKFHMNMVLVHPDDVNRSTYKSLRHAYSDL